VVVFLDEQDQLLSHQRFANPLPTILAPCAPYQADLTGVVVESTANWYWLGDGVMEADDRGPLAHPAARQPYSGLQETEDAAEARWVAHF
jgi:hypothetical protein